MSIHAWSLHQPIPAPITSLKLGRLEVVKPSPLDQVFNSSQSVDFQASNLEPFRTPANSYTPTQPSKIPKSDPEIPMPRTPLMFSLIYKPNRSYSEVVDLHSLSSLPRAPVQAPSALAHPSRNNDHFGQRRVNVLQVKLKPVRRRAIISDFYLENSNKFKTETYRLGCRASLTAFLTLEDIVKIERLCKAKLLTVSNPSSVEDPFVRQRIASGLCLDDYRLLYMANRLPATTGFHHGLMRSSSEDVSPMMKADIDRTMVQYLEFYNDRQTEEFKSNLALILSNLDSQASPNPIQYFQGLGSSIGCLLIAGMKPAEVYEAISSLNNFVEMNCYFKSPSEFSQQTAKLVVDLFFKLNLILLVSKPDFSVKIETIVHSWIMNLFGNTLSLPEYLSFYLLLQINGGKTLVCTSIALLELSLSRNDPRSNLQ